MIEQLADDSFRRREEAMWELVRMGPKIEPQVAAAVEADDPEVRYRSRRVLLEIDRAQTAQRRAGFIAGDDSQLKKHQASWRRFAKLVGDNRKSRELFVLMQKDGGELLDEAEENPGRCGAKIGDLYQRDMAARRFGGEIANVGMITAMVFVASDEKVKLDAAGMSRAVSLVYRAQSKLGDGEESFGRLLGGWMAKKDAADGNQVYQLLQLAQRFKVPEGVDLARRLLKESGAAPYQAQAALTLGMLGDKDDIPLLEKHLGSGSALGTISRGGGKRRECKLGDVALAMCIVLSDQKLREYQFDDVAEGRPTSMSYHLYGFENKESREKAQQKWKTWRDLQEK